MKAVLAKLIDEERDYITFISWNFSSNEIFDFLLENEERLRKKGAKNFFIEEGVYDKKWDIDTELINESDLKVGGDEIVFNHPNQRHNYEILNPKEVPTIKNIH